MITNTEPQKICTKCRQSKSINYFSPRKDSSDGRHSHCKACRRKYQKENSRTINAARRKKYWEFPEYRERIKEHNRRNGSKFRNLRQEHYKSVIRKRRWIIRLAIIEKYGGCCSCCKERIPEFLTIDHIDGNGYKERRTIGASMLYRKLYKESNCLPGYRILCYNCNCSLGQWGRCPHGNIESQISLLEKRKTN